MVKSGLVCGVIFATICQLCSSQEEGTAEYPYSYNPRANKTCSVASHCVIGDASNQEDYCALAQYEYGYEEYTNTCCLKDDDAEAFSENGSFYCFCCTSPCNSEGNCYRYVNKREHVAGQGFDHRELEVIQRKAFKQ